MPLKRWSLKACVFLIAVALAAGCAKSEPAPQSGTQSGTGTQNQPAPVKQELTIAVNSPTDTFDPSVGSSVPHQRLLTVAYETLLRFKPGTMEVEPALATKWDANPARTEFTVQLRKDVKFHDGAPFDAEAVKTSIERTKAIGKGESYLIAKLKEVVAVDPLTVKFVLTEPQPEFHFALTRLFMISPKAIKEHEQNGDKAQAWFQTHEAGTGPYKLTEWVDKQRYVFEKFPEYWGGWDGKHLEKVTFRVVIEGATQRLMLEKGEVDVAENIAVDDLGALSKNADLQVIRNAAPRPFYISFNTARKPLDDKRVREAITLAMDYKGAVDAGLNGYGSPMRGPIPEQFPGFNPAMKAAQQDLKRAKELLTEAGYGNGGIKLKFMFLEHWLFEKSVGLLLQDSLKQLGIDLQIEGQPWATMTAKMKDAAQAPDLVMYAQTVPTPSPYTILYPMYQSKSDHWSHFWYANPEVDALLNKVGSIADDNERSKVYQEIQSKVAADYPAIFVFSQDEVVTLRKNVKGYQPQLTWSKLLNYHGLYKE